MEVKHQIQVCHQMPCISTEELHGGAQESEGAYAETKVQAIRTGVKSLAGAGRTRAPEGQGHRHFRARNRRGPRFGFREKWRRSDL